MLYYTNQVDVLLDMGRKEEALQIIEQALKVHPLNANAWARRGQVLRRLSRNEAAIESYQKALEIDDTYAWAWNGQGLAFAALERWAEALSCYELAVHFNDLDAWFWHNYGEALLMTGECDAAIEALNRALEIDPTHEPTLKKLEIAYERCHGEEED
jgi:tetratricopeptide (TPR) repeat protein